MGTEKGALKILFNKNFIKESNPDFHRAFGGDTTLIERIDYHFFMVR